MSDASKSGRKLPKAVPLAPSQPAPPMAQPVPKAPTRTTRSESAPSTPPPALRLEPAAARESASTPAARGRGRSNGPVVLYSVLMLVLLIAGGAAGFFLLTREKPVLTLEPVPAQQIDELQVLKVHVAATLTGKQGGSIAYTMTAGPPGAVLDKQSGEFSWTPTEAQGPGQYEVGVRAEAPGSSIAPVVGHFTIQVNEVPQAPVVAEIVERTVPAGQAVSLKIDAKDRDLPPTPLTYRLGEGAPQGATLDAQTGIFQWTAPASGGEPSYEFKVSVAKPDGGPSAERSFRIRVDREPTPRELLAAHFGTGGVQVGQEGPEAFPPFPGKCHVFKVQGETVRVFDYANEAAAAKELAEISPDVGKLFGKPQKWESQPHVYHKQTLLALYVGTNAKLTQSLEAFFGHSVAEGVILASSTPAPKVETPNPSADELKQLAELYTTNKKIFVAKEYPTLRKLFAARFEREHAAQIRAGLASGPGGGDSRTGADQVETWLKAHPALREELYLAFDAKYDKIPEAMALIRELHKRFPTQLEPYWQLAIATAVTWDNPDAVYDFVWHQRRTHSNLTKEPMAGAIDNFKYFLDQEKSMQGRARHLPWEMLVHLVNNKTPLAERPWAMTNYVPRRTMFGKCYHDVPYDDLMLQSNDKQCKLQGQAYTLPNIRQYGGVCAMQADFAARVGKTIGVPAEFVGGAAADGELHAWVMWVELREVTENSVAFTLESHGRYRLDKYYVGDLTDPHTGQQITDRDLELRLHTVGMNHLAKRHADLLMRAFPLLRDELKLDAENQMVYLGKVMSISPGNEAAWRTMAVMSRTGTITPREQPRLKQSLDTLFKTFVNFPDFTWKVFDDLVAFYDKPKDKNELYQKLIGLYVAAKRPDLACEGRLKLTDYLVEQQNTKEAIAGLAATIRAFPDEGRYVPRMLDNLEAIAKGTKDSAAAIAQFYQVFLPTVPPKRGNESSPYCMKMYERGIARFKEAGQTALAQTYEAQLAKLRGGK